MKKKYKVKYNTWKISGDAIRLVIGVSFLTSIYVTSLLDLERFNVNAFATMGILVERYVEIPNNKKKGR